MVGTLEEDTPLCAPARNAVRGLDMRTPAAGTAKVSLKHAELLLLFQFFRVGLFCCCLDGLGLLCARARVDGTILDVDKGFVAQRGQEAEERRVRFSHVTRSMDTR